MAENARAWMVTVWPQSMKNMGFGHMLTDENRPKDGLGKELVDHIMEEWICSGKGRTCGAVACLSAKDGFHIHMGCYCAPKCTWKAVAKALGKAHVEEQISTKEQLTKYLRKEGEFEEKGEIVLYEKGLENLEDGQGSRSDLKAIEEYINLGWTPNRIMGLKFSYRKYSKMIRDAFFQKRRDETPFIRDVKVYWHVGESGSGKTYTAQKLMEEYGREEVYIITDYDSGGFDTYCAQRILFLEEYRGQYRYSQLLNILDCYQYEFHARYTNIVGLWTEVHITSVMPPETVYAKMVKENTKDDPISQLKRRIDTMVYHYKRDGEYYTYELPMDKYISMDDLKFKATGEEWEEATEEEMEEFEQMGLL